ncbi:hypothetical protein CSB37_00745 [bacterium DOLZORAL124_38_8]|nr:MAG: hypothetical protein CSB37_00745 [bacterium DOLZORAL124_38_8]
MAQRRVRKHVNPLSILHEVHFEGFENNNPLWMDIGACKGEFTKALAQKFPEKNFIACEIRKPLQKKLEVLYADDDNVVVFDGDAGKNFKTMLAPSFKRGVKLEKVFINFPDPWFKDRHKKRRFVNAKFLEDIKDFVDETTEFIFQTDQEFLFHETIEVLQDSAFSSITYFDESPFGVQTDWESAKVKEGNKIWRMVFKKQS